MQMPNKFTWMAASELSFDDCLRLVGCSSSLSSDDSVPYTPRPLLKMNNYHMILSNNKYYVWNQLH